MANAQIDVCLVKLAAAMLDTIKAAFPALGTVEMYREEEDRKTPITTPACLLELDEMPVAEGHDPGTEQVALDGRFAARFILGFRTPEVKLQTAVLAAKFAAFLRAHPHWPGVPTGPAQVIGCFKDDFDPRLDQYEVWRVEWSHVMNFGDSAWTAEGIAPTEVYLGFAPDIGAGNEGKYTKVTP